MRTSRISILLPLLILVLMFFIYLYFFKKNIKNKSGNVNYVVHFDSEKIKDSEKTYAIIEGLDLIDDLNDVSKKITFQLNFKNNKSLFYPKHVANDKISKLAVVLSGGKGVFYNKYSTTRVRQVKAFGNQYLIDYDLINILDWKIEGEEKIIQGYKCNKAILRSSDKNFEEITAWYSPDLPFKFGPRGIDNLPGLILELEIINRVKIIFTAVELSFNDSEDNISVPSEGIYITKNKFDIIKGEKLLELKD